MFASDVLVAQNIGFAIIATIMVVGALRVVTTSNVVHAALWLVVVLAGAAAQYVLLAAEFVVMVLFLFGTMLTRARIGAESDLNNKNWFFGIPVAIALFVAMAIALDSGFGSQKMPADPAVATTQEISDQIFGPYLLPFWALSFVLLAAVVGAIVLARRD